MLHTLMYSSVAAFALSDDEVTTLLSHSRERNAADDITGLLVYIRFDSNRAAFLQVLEGPTHAVTETYSRIERDELHRDLTMLRRSPTETTRFRQWSMKFVPLNESGLREVLSGATTSDPVRWLRDRATMEQVIDAVSQT